MSLTTLNPNLSSVMFNDLLYKCKAYAVAFGIYVSYSFKYFKNFVDIFGFYAYSIVPYMENDAIILSFIPYLY